MNAQSSQCILFFVKAPAHGAVKTRLGARIGGQRAAELYQCFGRDLLRTLTTLAVPLVCCFHPSEAGAACAEWLGEHLVYRPQRGDDLGQRMARAFRQAFDEGFSRVLLIGSDSPDLPLGLFERAFVALDTHEAVIGPSSDGGYYLIGFTAQGFLPAVFENVQWSTADVFRRTMNILQRHRRRTCVLPQWHDVDTWSDLEDLLGRNAATDFRNSTTFAFARRCGWTG